MKQIMYCARNEFIERGVNLVILMMLLSSYGGGGGGGRGGGGATIPVVVSAQAEIPRTGSADW